ncbi:MAG: DUF58 domain-containing protein [Akkermansiaceae bacterium]|nr:DUF58 domain-containing protein [Akkermansiaceae bacterium]
MSIRPTKWLIRLLILWFVLAIAAIWSGRAGEIWLIAGACLATLFVSDGALAFSVKKPIVTRKISGRFAVSVESEVTLRVANSAKRVLHLSVYDGLPGNADCALLPWRGSIKGGGYVDVTYPVTLHERGEQLFNQTHLLLVSPLGLWSRRTKGGQEDLVKVYPNYQPVLRFALMAMAQRQEQTGIIRKNRAGLSRDFHQLRDYQFGDSLSQIDWKASSKRRSLISRDFQEQLDQSVILMLDCGRRMRTLDGEVSQFDHCLNSMLLVSYVALRQGDHVGILSFGGTERWLPPVKGSHAMTAVLNHLYDYETSPYPSDFSEAAERLLRHQQRRAMVVVLTNLRGEDGDELVEPLRKLRQKHVVVLASLRESGIDRMLNDEVAHFDGALGYLAAQDYSSERERVLANLRSHGVVALDETAQRFPVALANRYLDTRETI